MPTRVLTEIAGVLAVAFLGSACAHSPARPPPRDCPPGALDEMRELGIKVGTEKAGSLLHGVYSASGPRPETVPVSNEKRAIVDLGAPWEDVFGRMSLHGQLFVRDERVYGYFTQAGYALTKNLSVCFVLVDEKDLQPGVRKLSSSGSDSVRIPSRVVVRAVSRLE